MIIIFIIYLLKFIATSSSTIQTIKVRENVNVTLTCRLYSGLRQEQQRKIPLKTLISSSSSSEGIILWYKDDTTVIGVNSISNDPANYIIQQLDFETYELTVLHVQLEDTGEYKCQNFTAKEENRFQLTVIG
ncbi:unnamed protein product [Didymodactylos carnosus]|uniref:Ig-like domain-containing protein n=1 Tax=Didymodactylos carnosus TaxID=1234261 RepID=A0A8S2U3H6_9BILA|nr:unnamed protein product [Didymodactylos carnosus]CAF4296750.1 unnamed protein product [Didymodactylos carnosus]